MMWQTKLEQGGFVVDGIPILMQVIHRILDVVLCFKVVQTTQDS